MPIIGFAPTVNWTTTTGSSTIPCATNSGVTFTSMPQKIYSWTNSLTGDLTSDIYYGYDSTTSAFTANLINVTTMGESYLNYIYNPVQTIWNYVAPVFKTAKERLSEILESRMAPKIISTNKSLSYPTDERERRARETLRRVVGENKFKDFVRRGSISVKAKSGLVYQIFPGHDFTKVYDCGKLVDRLCVVLQGGFPPTDNLIMRYLMILNNEQQFRSFAVKHGVSEPIVRFNSPDNRSLVEIFKELKAA
jgi:hypothetical protein